MQTEKDEIPTLSEDDVESVESLMGQWDLSDRSEPLRCSNCGKEAVWPSDDLEWTEASAGLFFQIVGLSGERCESCGEAWFDSKSFARIQEKRRGRFAANYEVSISKVSGNSVGIYFPKDLRRIIDLNPGKKALLTPVSDNVILMEVKESEDSSAQEDFQAIDESLGL